MLKNLFVSLIPSEFAGILLAGSVFTYNSCAAVPPLAAIKTAAIIIIFFINQQVLNGNMINPKGSRRSIQLATVAHHACFVAGHTCFGTEFFKLFGSNKVFVDNGNIPIPRQ
jgi:hypothetical protein